MTDAYRDYLKKYCGCEGAVCAPKVTKSDVEESQKGVKPHLLIVQQRLELARFKKRLADLDKKLKKCDREVI